MKRTLLAAGTALAMAGSAFAPATFGQAQTIQVQVPQQPGTTTTIQAVPAPTPAMPPPGAESSGSTVATVIVAPMAPPPPQAEVIPPPPAPTEVWQPGHWSWNPNHQHYGWTQGSYVEPPRAQAAWVPGSWQQQPNGWVWVEGHWN